MICSPISLQPYAPPAPPLPAPFSSVLAPRGATALPTHTNHQNMHAAWKHAQASDTHTSTLARARLCMRSESLTLSICKHTHTHTHTHALPSMHVTVTRTHEYTDARSMHTHAHAHSLRTYTHTRTHRLASTNKRTHGHARKQGCAILEVKQERYKGTSRKGSRSHSACA
jgi:hypothetical protein